MQYHFEITTTPATATITAELEDATPVEFDNNGKTKLTYDFETKITKIKITAPGYEDGDLDDHTIAAEVVDNKKTKALTRKKVL